MISNLPIRIATRGSRLALHSMQDVPVELPSELHMSSVLAPDDPRDCLRAPRHGGLRALPARAVIGTSSLRRRSQILSRGDRMRDAVVSPPPRCPPFGHILFAA